MPCVRGSGDEVVCDLSETVLQSLPGIDDVDQQQWPLAFEARVPASGLYRSYAAPCPPLPPSPPSPTHNNQPGRPQQALQVTAGQW